MKKPKPKYKKGDIVKNYMLMREVQIEDEPKWNGFTWMYSFVNEEMRCGESYLGATK